MGKNNFSLFAGISLLIKIGFGMLTPIIGGVFLGKYLDSRFSKNSLFLVIFTILGAVLAFQYLLVMSIKISKDKKQ